MKFSPRQQAIATGAKTYFTGKPCRHGHVAYRYTQSATCSQCINQPDEKPKIPKILVEPWSNDPGELIPDSRPNGGYWLRIRL